MNTANIKCYAPQARNDFMQAVARRLNLLGIATDKKGELLISDVVIDGSVMQIAGNSFDASMAESRNKLVKHTQKQGFNQFVEHTAYTWFNRFCAIRFMELHDYLEHGHRVLSHPSKDNGFEILDHAQDVAEELGLNRDHIVELKLAGNKDEQLYRELLTGQCHKLHQAMPFLFEALDDETELLLPDNLTRTDSLLRGLVNDIPEQDWQQVEIIGWLYQFYISEKKDEVIGKVVKSEDIPAATQLFTPNWIVKYLVQNSVGRKWCQTYPDSTIKSEMEYYIEPAEQTDEVNAELKAITPDSIDPETIKVLDPACGSGHILVEAYNVLKSIYEERGYRSRDIPKLILENNLFGIDIDDRAAQLAGFALMMLARNDDRLTFTRDVKLNILSLQETANADLNSIWRELEIQDNDQYQIVQDIWTRFEQAKTFGSLIDIPVKYEPSLKVLLSKLTEIEQTGSLLQSPAARDLKPIIQQACLLAQRYDAVVANPPYIGGKGMNAEIKMFAKTKFPNTKADLFSMFIERCLCLGVTDSSLGFVTPFTWMFISSYEKLRNILFTNQSITTLVKPSYHCFFESAIVPLVTFTIQKSIENIRGSYIDLGYLGSAESQPIKLLDAIHSSESDMKYLACKDDFKQIYGSPIAYDVSKKLRNAFSSYKTLGEISDARQGLATTDNNRFLRLWSEVNLTGIGFSFGNIKEAQQSGLKWFPYNKGGAFRKWYGNQEYIVNWENDGQEIKENILRKYLYLKTPDFVAKNTSYYFQPSVSWSFISSSSFGVRYYPEGFIFDVSGSSVFSEDNQRYSVASFLCSKLASKMMKIMNPTLNFQVGNVVNLPYKSVDNFFAETLISNSKLDWDCYEYSWEFQGSPLISELSNDQNLKSIYVNWQQQKSSIITEMQRLEEDNNRLLIDAYGLEDEFSPEVSLEQITLTVNPKYRYGGKLSDEELDSRFQSDTLAELISYSIGCMMGRYSLDKEGLVYAHAGNEGFSELEQQGAYNTFPADHDGIIPLTDQEWFEDDVTLRFREFVQTVWCKENLQANLDFVAESLCLHSIKPKSGETSLETIRRYLSNQFYKDHLKTYKKRPIYWLFSSGKHKAFECLVYLHRYNEGTLARMRTEYVTPLLGKYEATADLLNSQIEQASSTAEANRLSKSLTALEKKQTELREFDDKLKHYADMQTKLDLDDGVKVNYGKFGDLLVDVKSVHGKAVN